MKRLLTLLVLVAATTAIHAQDATAPAAPAAPAAAAAPATGEKMTVIFVGATKISVKPGNGKDKSIESTKYNVTPETTITINGAVGQLSQIKPGHKVMITPVAGQPDVAASITMTKKSAE